MDLTLTCDHCKQHYIVGEAHDCPVIELPAGHIQCTICKTIYPATQWPVHHCSSTEKPSNPKDACGIAKVPMSVVPATVLQELGVAMLEGALKYGRHNYRAVGVRHSVYYDAAMRHLMAWWEGEDTDPDSGMSHIIKAIASLVVLRDSTIRGNDTDDRPPVAPAGLVTELNKRVVELMLKHADKNPVHYTKENCK